MQQLPLGVRLHDRATYASFLAFANEQALAALRGLEGGHGGALWLHGPTGSGKSHLLQAWCADRQGRAFLPLAQLHELGPSLLEGADRLAGVAIDDAGVVAGEHAWEEALFRLYNDCEAAQVPLVIGDAAPSSGSPWRLADLRSRFGAMVHVTLRALDEAGQRAALQLHAAQRGLELPEEAAQYMQRRFPRDMHSLYALLDRLDAAALREQRRLTIPFIRQVTGGST